MKDVKVGKVKESGFIPFKVEFTITTEEEAREVWRAFGKLTEDGTYDVFDAIGDEMASRGYGYEG